MPVPQLVDLGFSAGLSLGFAGPAVPAPSTSRGGAPPADGTLGPGPGRPTNGGLLPHGHPTPRESIREGGARAGRAMLSPHGATRGRPCSPIGCQPTFFLDRPILPRHVGNSSTRGRWCGQGRAPLHRPTSPAHQDSPGAPMETDPDQVSGAEQGGTQAGGGMTRPPWPAPSKWMRSRQRGRQGSTLNPTPSDRDLDPSVRPPIRHVVLPNAALRASRWGLTYGMGLPAVAGIPPPLATPIKRRGPAGCLALRPRHPGVLGLPGDITTVVAVPGATLLHGGTGGSGPGQQPPP